MIADELWPIVKKLGEGTKLTDLTLEELTQLDHQGLIVMVLQSGTRHYELNEYGKKLVEMAVDVLKGVLS